jgi:hypothetical protein
MMPNVELGEEFFSQVLAMDAELSRRVAAAGCPTCGGPLHQAHYQRKPRGGLLARAGEAFSLRHSLCCGREGCRKRTLPPSFRFLGRRVYLEGVVLLAGMAVQVAAGALRAVSAATGVPSWTLRRWRCWWGETFPRSSTWRKLRARFRPPPPDQRQLPRSLLDRFERDREGEAAVATSGEICLRAARCLLGATTTSKVDFSRLVGGVGLALASP